MHLGDPEASNFARRPEIVGYLEIEETSEADDRYRVHEEHLITDDQLPTCEVVRQKIIGKTSAADRRPACRYLWRS